MVGNQPKRKERPGVDEYGRISLHYAAGDGNAPLVKQLLSSGVDPNAPDDNDWTPLHFAAQAYSPDVIETLLEAGANPDLQDSFGNTALFRAVFNSRGDGSVIKLLRAAGADPNAENDSGVSPLSLARTIGNYDVAQYFADLP